MKKLSFLFFILPLISIAQTFEHESYDWDPAPKNQTISKDEAKESFIFLRDKNTIEFTYDDQGKEVRKYIVRHYIVKVNDSKAIDYYNKVFIPLKEVVDIIDLKARAITREGKITEVHKDNIKEVKNFEDMGAYKIFAIDGIAIGSDVEVLYKLKKYPIFYGNVVLQRQGIVKNGSLELIAPPHLIFEAKCYNIQPRIIDTVYNEKHFWEYYFDSIPALKEEKYAKYDADLAKIEFKFSHNREKSNSEIYSFSLAAQRLYEVIYEPDEKADRKLTKIISELKLKSLSEEEKIKKIENHIKNNFIIKEHVDIPDIENLTSILKNKFSTETGIIKLYAQLLTRAKINHQVVVTSNRDRTIFDKDFMTWSYLTDFLIYFPTLDKYIAPVDFAFRFDMYPPKNMDNYGLFLKIVEIGELKTAMPEIKYIPANSDSNNVNTHNVTVKIAPSFNKCDVDLFLSFRGHPAMFIHPYYNFLDEDKKKAVIEDLAKRIIGEDAIINKIEVESYDQNVSPITKPFTIKGNMTLKSIIEKAGNNYLFKVGELLGEQVEMYDEGVRKCPIVIDAPHRYSREIKFDIPEGYELKGLEKTKFNIEYGDGKANTMGFVSDYKIDGNKAIINIREYYSVFEYPISQYKQYTEVVNAAADFNKIVLVFEKK